MSKFKEGVLIISKWEGREDKISPLGFEFLVGEEMKGEVYEYIKNNVFDMEKYRNDVLNRELNDYQKNKTFFIEHEKQLKEDCRDSKVKVTIKIELEKIL